MEFSARYLQEVSKIAKLIDTSVIVDMIDELVIMRKNRGRLFILGVGGSAGNASHAVNDFRKLASIEAYAPSDNISEISARANDEGWDSIFEGYLKVSALRKPDVLLVLSVGGGDETRGISRNLCRAIDFAKSQEVQVFAIVGREIGYSQQNADRCLVIPEIEKSRVTPHSESFQAVVWHLMVSHPKLKMHPTTW